MVGACWRAVQAQKGRHKSVGADNEPCDEPFHQQLRPPVLAWTGRAPGWLVTNVATHGNAACRNGCSSESVSRVVVVT